VGLVLGARTLRRNTDFSSSEILFESAAQVVPNSARVHFQLGALLAGQQLYGKAEEHYTRALEIHPSMLQSAIGLGNVHLAAKNWDRSIAVFDSILSQLLAARSEDPVSQDEIARQVYTSRSAAKAGKGDMDGAAADLRQALQLAAATGSGELRVGPHLQLARLLADRGRPQEALPVLRQALALQPENVDALYMLANYAHRLQDAEAYEEALSGLEQTERGRPFALALRAEGQFEQALAARDETGLQQALAQFEEVRKLLPQLAAPYLYRGRYFFEKGRFPDAILELDRALERTPRLPMALLVKARAQNASGRPKDALATTRELELVAPDAECYTVMFRSLFMLQEFEEMLVVAAKLSELGVSAVDTVLDLSIALRNAGRLDDAIAAIEVGRTLPDAANDPVLLRSLAVLLIDADRPDEALSILDLQEAAESASPDLVLDPFLPINRARCYMALDRDVEAAAQLELFEADVVPESRSWLSLAHRRAELFLKRGSPFFNPAQAVELSAQGLAAAAQHKVGSPPLLDASIEALVAAGDLPGAVARAREARSQYPELTRYRAAEDALQRAVDGDRAAAVEGMRRTGDAMLARVAAQLEG
jgi:tetratricopeptide (TPR) repeat protein